MNRPVDEAAAQQRKRPRIRRRLALITATVTATVLLAFCLPLAVFVRNVAYDRAIDSAEQDCRALAAELAGIGGQAAAARITRQAASASAGPITVFLSGGRRLGAALPSSVRVPRAVLAEHAVTTIGPGGGRLVWEPVHDKIAARAVVVSVPPGLLSSGVPATWALIFGGGAALVLIAVALADRLGRSIVRSLLDLVTVTNRLRDGDLTSRGQPSGPCEVAEVGHAVNELADRIEALLAAGRLAAADLSHRLRTPLTALRLHAGELSDPAERRGLTADIDAFEQAVNELIKQTRQAPARTAAAADLVAAVRDRMAYWTVLARSQDRHASVRLPGRDRVQVAVSRDELDAAIDALLSNVFIHTPEGTPFSVSLRRAGQDAAGWVLVVENPCQAAAPRIAPPATRSASVAASTGTGLGLDIVRRTAARAGGSVRAGQAPDGGFKVEISLPGQAQAAGIQP
jgi:signal transduction histidine kinase